MKKTSINRILVVLVGILMVVALADIAKASINLSIEVKDSGGNSIGGGQVPLYTDAYVSGYYEDPDGSASAEATIDVYFDGGAGLAYEATIFSSTVHDGETVTADPYTMSELGVYEFRWTVVKDTGAHKICLEERSQARTRVQLHVPEPATIAGLAMAFSAFGLILVKKAKK